MPKHTTFQMLIGSIDGIQKSINEWLTKGYELHGGMMIHETVRNKDGENVTIYSQPVVKTINY